MGMGDLSERVGFSMSIVVYQKKQNRMILIVKDFLLVPLSTSFLLCQILIDIQSKKINQCVTVAEPGSCPTICPFGSRKTHQTSKKNHQRILRIVLTQPVSPPPLTISLPNAKKKEETLPPTSYLLLLSSQQNPSKQASPPQLAVHTRVSFKKISCV